MKRHSLSGLVLTGVLVAACDGSSGSGGAGGTGGAGGAGGTGGGGAGGGAGGAVQCVPTGQQPQARSEMMGVLDPVRQKLVFFGGDTGVPVQCNPAPKPGGELWVYDRACVTFSEVAFTDGPSPRARGAAIYDPDGDRMLVFGGRYRAGSSGPYTVFNDVWALDLATLTWQEVVTTGTPPSKRSSTTAVYDAATKEMVVYGGNASTNGLAFTPLGDAFALNLTTGEWREIPTGGVAPEARLFHAAALDPTGGQLFVYAGGDANAFTGPFLGDLWALDVAQGGWTELHPGGGAAPMGRINPALAFDAGKLVMFGGHDDGAVGNNNDTWTFDLAAGDWTGVIPAETVQTPPPQFCLFPPDYTVPNLDAPDRRSAFLASDVSGGEWVVFGGKTDCGLVDDVWTLDVASTTWARELEATVGEACIRGDNPGQCTTLCQ